VLAVLCREPGRKRCPVGVVDKAVAVTWLQEGVLLCERAFWWGEGKGRGGQPVGCHVASSHGSQHTAGWQRWGLVCGGLSSRGSAGEWHGVYTHICVCLDAKASHSRFVKQQGFGVCWRRQVQHCCPQYASLQGARVALSFKC
jgi:hypothetical protein